MNTFPETESLILEEVKSTDQKALIVYNDDVNTFEHVIDTLIKICDHSPEQAEQCTTLIHYKGRCSVKIGGFDELAPLRSGICDRGISAEIE